MWATGGTHLPTQLLWAGHRTGCIQEVSRVQLGRAVKMADDHSGYGDLIEKATQYTIRILNDSNKKANGGPIDTFPIVFQGSTVLVLMEGQRQLSDYPCQGNYPVLQHVTSVNVA